MRYELQINDWTSWVTDRSFTHHNQATFYAREKYSQNEWRVYDNVRQQVIHEHDPSETLRQVAGSDLDRFERVTEWTLNQRLRQTALQAARRNAALLHRGALQRASIQRNHRDFSLQEGLFCGSEMKGDKVNWLQEGF